MAGELKFALDLVHRASRMTRLLQQKLVQPGLKINKGDLSPVTVADFAVQALVLHGLHERFPNDVFIAEERSKELQNHPEVIQLIAETLPKFGAKHWTPSEICAAIDLGGVGSTSTANRKWVLDPVDGTKGFLRREQYCIALALLDKGAITVGVLGCPELPGVPATGPGCVVYAQHGSGARSVPLSDPNAAPSVLRVSPLRDASRCCIVESVESGHSDHNSSQRILDSLGTRSLPLRMDSQCKYAEVARGGAHAYLRLPKKGYVENIWDHAAGWLVVTEAGGRVTDVLGEPLDFTAGSQLSRQKAGGIVVTNGHLHKDVLVAVQRVLGH